VTQAAKVLLVDDEQSILDLVSAYLRPEGYEIRTATDGVAGLKLARTFKPDVVVLDIMLPEMDGIELLSQLRRESEAYVIMLTAKTEETDKVIGLSVGADDYVTKPFSPRELVARIKAALRRMRLGRGLPDEQVFSYAHLRIDSGSRRAWMDDQEIELTTMEFDLLWALAEHPGKVLSRERLLERVWGYDYYGEIRVVDVHIGHIRGKLGNDGLIATVRGVGYRFEDTGE
jgi:two-component system alkaline phosphatase synthesis response regulator PhoP